MLYVLWVLLNSEVDSFCGELTDTHKILAGSALPDRVGPLGPLGSTRSNIGGHRN